jgi:hypothetical protein
MHGIGYGSMWKDLLEIKQFLPAAPPVDLRQWQDPSIGWGLVLGEPDEPRGSRPVLREAGGGAVRKNSIRLPSDGDVGTYLFGFPALENPRSQPCLAENTSQPG